jgi:hypothetical protein
MQACTDIGHTRAPVETATVGPSNCGDIASGRLHYIGSILQAHASAEPRPTNQRGVVKQSSLADSKYPLLGLHSQQCTLARYISFTQHASRGICLNAGCMHAVGGRILKLGHDVQP